MIVRLERKDPTAYTAGVTSLTNCNGESKDAVQRDYWHEGISPDQKWLGDQESNLGSQIQNLLSCP